MGRKKILITGAGGFIGGALAKYFCRHPEYSLYLLYRNKKPNIDRALGDVFFIQADLSLDNLEKIEPVDIIIHAAASTHITPHVKMKDYISSNIQGMINIVEYAKRSGVEIFFFISTFSVYGQLKEQIVTEKAPLYQPGLYGATKYTAELILQEYSQYFSSLCVRLPGVVEPGYFIPWLGRILKKAYYSEEITIYNEEALFNNVVSANMLFDFLKYVIIKDWSAYEMVNLAADSPLPIKEIIRLIMKMTKSESLIKVENKDKSSFYVNIEKIKNIFNYNPRQTREVVEMYIVDSLKLLSKR